ncbi:hypothetical protein ACKFKF_09185 [Phormidesmis sp. 146-12]
MIEVSTLELLVKRIAPKMALPPAAQSVARRVVQGYFLTISNLEAKDLRYRLEFRISLPDSPADMDAVDRILEGNTFLIYDIAGFNNILTLNRIGMTGRYVSQEFIIPAQKTASVELLPDVTKFASLPDPQLEIRGYVSLSLPRDFSGSTPFEKLIGKPQLPQPAKVLLNAEIRGTFLPNDFPSNPNSADFDQINYSLTLASGKALNLVPSEPSRLLVPGSAVGIEVTSEIPSLPPANGNGTDSANLVSMLAAMLSNGNGNGSGNGNEIETLNQSFAELNLPLRMSAL